MRGQIPDYELVHINNLAETLALLASAPGIYKPFSGGTDIMVLLEAGHLKHRHYVDVNRLQELRGITVSEKYIEIGASESYSAIQSHELIRNEFPCLVQAGAETGGFAIQNRGTLGGNIANASPAADSPPALIAYDAELNLISSRGDRWVACEKFFKSYKVIDLAPDELIKSIRLRRRKESNGERLIHFYQKAGTRKAQAISKVVFCATAVMSGSEIKDARISVGSVAPVTLRCRNTEKLLIGYVPDSARINEAVAAILKEISPVDDIRSNKEFRSVVTKNLLVKFLGMLA